jgi:uncharacterized damage-inducible protein DinB
MIPPPDYFTHLFDYVKWADLRQLDATRGVSDDEYFKERGWSFGNIHKVQVHELAAQSVWLDRFVGDKAVWLFDDPRLAKREALEPQWRSLHARFTNFLRQQTPQTLVSEVRYTNFKGDPLAFPLWQLLVHTCNHASHHRGQLNSMIKLAGAKPISTDYAAYIAQVVTRL